MLSCLTQMWNVQHVSERRKLMSHKFKYVDYDCVLFPVFKLLSVRTEQSSCFLLLPDLLCISLEPQSFSYCDTFDFHPKVITAPSIWILHYWLYYDFDHNLCNHSALPATFVARNYTNNIVVFLIQTRLSAVLSATTTSPTRSGTRGTVSCLCGKQTILVSERDNRFCVVLVHTSRYDI